MQGELYLARRSRPVTTPAPLPAELQQGIDHPLAGIRAGAVQELARLVRGRHAGLALAAALALECLTTDDSRAVAAAATEALAAVDPEGASARIGAAATGDLEPTPAGGQAPPVREATTAGHIEPTREDDPGKDDPVAVGSSAPAPPPAPAPVPAEAAPDVRSPRTAAGTAGSSRRSWFFGRAASTAPTDPTAAATGIARPGGPRRRRVVYIAGAAVVLALAGTVASLVLPDGGQSPVDEDRPAKGTFTATSPWRLVIRNESEVDGGCDVSVTNTDAGEKSPDPVDGLYGMKSYQIAVVGNFRWDANDAGCLVVQRSGPGKVVLPFVQQAGTGDTDAITPPKTERQDRSGGRGFPGQHRMRFPAEGRRRWKERRSRHSKPGRRPSAP